MKITLVDDTKILRLYTDGSCYPNPGPGGWAVIEELDDKGPREYFTRAKGSDHLTSNVKMEGQAILEAISYAAGRPVMIFTDSEIWINTLTKWAPVWERQGWRNNSGLPVKNRAMVEHLLALYRMGNVKFRHVRGHQGNMGNEFADEVAGQERVEQAERNKQLMESAK